MNMYESFSHLCNQLLLEYSSTFDLVKNPDGTWHPGAKEIIDQVMRQKMISHDVQWEPIDANALASWAKKIKKGAILILTDQGTALLETSPSDPDWFSAYVADENEMQRLSTTTKYKRVIINFTFDKIMPMIQNKIGHPQRAYITADLGQQSVQKLQKKRKQTQPQPLSYAQILMRFKPLWEKTLIQAMADVKGWYSQLVKNDAYKKASKKMRQIEYLREILDDLESNNTDSLKKNLLPFMTTAVHMAAAHYYPDPPGSWTEEWNETLGRFLPRYKATGIVAKLLKDIEAGDMRKLGAVLHYLKQELVKGF